MIRSTLKFSCSEDGACLFFRDNEELPCRRCFEEGVLPLNEDLEREYRLEHQMEVSKNKAVKTNVKCSLQST